MGCAFVDLAGMCQTGHMSAIMWQTNIGSTDLSVSSQLSLEGIYTLSKRLFHSTVINAVDVNI